MSSSDSSSDSSFLASSFLVSAWAPPVAGPETAADAAWAAARASGSDSRVKRPSA